MDMFDFGGGSSDSKSGGSTGNGLDAFDPFGSVTPQTSAKPSPTLTAVPHLTSGGFSGLLGEAPPDISSLASADLTISVGISGSDAVENFRAVEEAKAKDLAGREEARKGLEATLNAWEFKGGTTRNNIRTLLSNLHTILWEGSRWKKVTLADLLDIKKVKLSYRKALIVVHPDKLKSDAPPEHKVIAQRAFEVLNESWQTFADQNNC